MPYKENRVYVRDYASLPANSPLLLPITTAPGHVQQYAHHLLVAPFNDMGAACFADLGIHLAVASGRRDPLWSSQAAYEKDMIKQYGSVEKGRKFRAYQSPHQTGLAIDLACGGISPVSATIQKQKQTRLYKWLVSNMWTWGFTPYLAEPWHLECRVDPASYWDGTSSTLASSDPLTTCSDENDVCEAPHDWVTRD